MEQSHNNNLTGINVGEKAACKKAVSQRRGATVQTGSRSAGRVTAGAAENVVRTPGRRGTCVAVNVQQEPANRVVSLLTNPTTEPSVTNREEPKVEVVYAQTKRRDERQGGCRQACGEASVQVKAVGGAVAVVVRYGRKQP